MFSGSSGRKLGTWKSPVWPSNVWSFLLMCPFHKSSLRVERGSHSCYCQKWVILKPEDEEQITCLNCFVSVWRPWKLDWDRFYPNSDVPPSSLLKPLLSVHFNNRPVLKDRCVIWDIIITVNHICTSFVLSPTAALSYHSCKEINQWVVCIHTYIHTYVSVWKKTMNHIFG